MKKILLCFILIATTQFVHAQAGEWTWMKGSNSPNSTGSFGVKGTASATNNPPALYGPALWLDASNNIWMFGGVFYNTLWKYDIATNEWTWMNGTTINSSPGVYGTMGIPSAANTPGARGYGFLSWKDLNGDFWIYGGDGFDTNGNEGLLNDLWKYSYTTNEWTWMNGSNSALPALPPDYGTQGVPSPTNTPGGREETTFNWVDDSGNLWFYGGFDNNISLKDDVWKYDVTLNQWVWMAGSSSINVPPDYGTQGVPSPANNPGGRNAYSHWKDEAGNVWLFGGSQLLTQSADLWKFDMATLEWTWMSGSNVPNAAGNMIGLPCSADTSYFPLSRSENRACWTDECGNFWMFGGMSLLTGVGYDNDLLVYRPAKNDWTWASGSLATNASGNYGIQGVSSPTNVPGGRKGAPGIYDLSGNLWMFGGQFAGGVGVVGNDLWKFVPDTACPSLIGCGLQIAFISSDTNVCEKFCIDFFDQSVNNPTSWLWEFPGGTPSSSTDQNPTSVCYNNPGTFDVTLITTNANGSDTLTLPNFITVNPTPAIPTITQTGYTLTSSTASTYLWQFNNVDIPGATNQSYDVTQTGYYTVLITDQNGCTASATTYVLITGIENMLSHEAILIYPNPSSGNFIVECQACISGGEMEINIYNTLGQLLFSSKEKTDASGYRKEIDLCDNSMTCVATGVYFIEIKTNSDFLKKKIMVLK